MRPLQGDDDDDYTDDSMMDDDGTGCDHDLVVLEFRRLIALLASTRPDTQNNRNRKALLDEAQDCITTNYMENDEDDDEENEEKDDDDEEEEDNTARDCRRVLAEWNDLQCSSKYAYRRVIPLFAQSVVLQQQQQQEHRRKVLPTGTTPAEQKVKDDNDTDNDQILLGLVSNLVRLLDTAKDDSLVEYTQQLLATTTTPAAAAATTNSTEQQTASKDDDHSININKSNKQRLASILFDIAQSSSSSKSSALSAVALGSYLDSCSNTTDTTTTTTTTSSKLSFDWLSIVISTTLADFSSRQDLQTAKTFLQTLSFEKDWTTTLSKALQLKLKSHPDKFLETLLGWILFLNNDAPVLDEEWMSLLFKQLVSPKLPNRQIACYILKVWASKNNVSLLACLDYLAKQKVTLAPARAHFYDCLEGIAKNANLHHHYCTATTTSNNKNNNNDNNTLVAIPDDLIAQVIQHGLIDHHLSKEVKADQRLLGQQALMEWLMVAERRHSQRGLDSALTAIREPVVAKKAALAGPLLSLLVQRIHPDLLERIVLQLWTIDNKNKKQWDAGLEAIVKEASTKKSLLVEGLLVIYLTLLYCNASKQTTVPAFCDAVLAPGKLSSTSTTPTTFFYSQSLLDAATNTNNANNSLISHCLLQSLALYTQLAAKAAATGESPSTSTTTAVPVNLFPKGKLTHACRAMAFAMSHPASAMTTESSTPLETTTATAMMATTLSSAQQSQKSKDQYVSQALVSSLETILQYQPIAAEGLVQALLHRVNQAALAVEDLLVSANATREARESSDEATVTASSATANSSVGSGAGLSTTSLASVKGSGSVNASHRGFDANAVRLAARVLSRHYYSSTTTAKPMTSVATASEGWAHILLLMHAGTSLRSEGHQRAALMVNTTRVIQQYLVPLDNQFQKNSKNGGGEDDFPRELAQQIVRWCAAATTITTSRDTTNSLLGGSVSTSLHEAGLSLLTTLGGVASNYDSGAIASSNDDEDAVADPEMVHYAFASKMCTQHIAVFLDQRLQDISKSVEELSESDLLLFLTPAGTLFQQDDAGGADSGSNNATEVKRGGKRLSEDEEWELQMRKELAEKEKKKQQQKGGASAAVGLSQEEKKLLAEQDSRRADIGNVLHGDFIRVLSSIQYLCVSDIEVGNQCLPTLMENVVKAATSTCSAATSVATLSSHSLSVLTALATCVYEIHEMHAPTIAQALVISCRRDEVKKDILPVASPTPGPASSNNATDSSTSDTSSPSKSGLLVKELPSPCAPAACVIYEMESFGDTFSGPSFGFLLPVLRASLMGPRTPPGCESALRVLERHSELLSNSAVGNDDTARDARVVALLRRDMAIAVLELLKYDRSQTFQNPTALETLVACYQTNEEEEGAPSPPLTTAELAPLLDERGALSTSKSCRVGAMMVLEDVAKRHRKLIKNNPLVENRIWLNCFEEKDEDVRTSARRTWLVVQDAVDSVDSTNNAELPAPSPLYSAPLLPLLSHVDSSIAIAAAAAFGDAMGKHPKSVPRNVEKICSIYIESFPTEESSGSGGAGSKSAAAVPAPKSIAAAAAPKKPSLTTGLPKKKAVAPKSALAVAGIVKPKNTVKKKLATSALLKPKEERTLDKEALELQFKTGVATSSKKDVEKDSPAKVSVRKGVIRAIGATTKNSVKMDEATLKQLTSFLIAYGIADPDLTVNNAARDALRDVVASNGGSDTAVAFLLPHLESVLKTGKADESALGSLPTAKVPKDVAASDRRKEAVVVALGSVALHLKGAENESKIDGTIDMLIAALKTPSEDVQLSVADALTKLMKKGRTQDRIDALISTLLRDCLNGATLAVQRGSAYGLAACVKGSGIASLKKFDVVKQLEEACSSGNAKQKEGSLFAIELLSDRLGLLFEPYVISILPSLLKAFSDGSEHVRKAAANTVGVIMGKLSAHGVKLVMPAVLTAFNDPAWRTKQASIHMLGAMSHLAPKQLASALPKVVPKLTEAFADTHPKVKASAQEALNEISVVVRNPEISEISPALLKALTDPADYTVKALETLIATEFLHAIDAPSLALIVPILHRGLRDRGATTKRFSGLITGNITTMINDPKDLIPYLPTLLPDLQYSLLDPIPDVRTTSAKALGSLTRSLGDQILPELRPWLVKKLRETSCSSAERSGAAQGLTEVLIASGSAVVDDAMRNEILPLRNSPEASTREGVLWMLTFLPPSMGQGFTPLIDVSFPVLIAGLSDDSEPVRDTALRAGRVLIRSHGKVHVDKILPSLEEGLGNDDYRIRLASLNLLGDLLAMIGGTTIVKGEGDTQDDIRRAERAQAQLALALGATTRKRVLSGLYLARSDSVHMVRQSALQVWKTVVSVTGRTLREILPVLVSRVVDDLASGNEMKTLVAGRCLGDIVGKLGESVLPQIIPVLRNALYDGDEHTKRGVCVGLSDVIQCSTKDQILRFIEIVSKVVQDALCDESESVRKMAAYSFQSLHGVVGNRAFDEIVPSLMVALESSDSDRKFKALYGLTGILTVRSKELLPYIVPRLISRPITTDHAKALAGVATVTGNTLYSHYGTIIPALLGDLCEMSIEGERAAGIRECSRSICASCDEQGVNILVSEIAGKCGNDKASLRRESCRMLEVLITERAEMKDFYDQIPIIMRELLYRLNDEDQEVLLATNATFGALSKTVEAEELVKNIEFMRNLLSSMVSDARRRKGGVGDGQFLLPGFNIPKGLDPLMPIYQRGILYGNPTIREVAATGLGEVIELTSTKYLAGPLVVKMTGPLLRIVGDRNPANVKIAILKTLGLLLVKGGPALRAFVPQFQTTFVKALSDPSRQVRMEAIIALSLLMPLSTRVDPLMKELVTSALGKGIDVEGLAAAAIQTASLEALAVVLEKGGSKAKLPEIIPSALSASKELLKGPDDGIRESAAKVMGAACALLSDQIVIETIEDEIMDPSDNDSSVARHGKACAIYRILEFNASSRVSSVLTDLLKISKGFLNDDKSLVREAGCVAIGAVIGRSPDPKASFAAQQADLLTLMSNSRESMEVHRALARGLCVALNMIEGPDRLETMGIPLVDASLQLAMSGTQRVQYAFNDVLWLVLDIEHSGEHGLDRYADMAVFDNVRQMKSLHSKVLCRQKEAATLKL